MPETTKSTIRWRVSLPTKSNALNQYEGYYHYLPVNDTAMSWGVYLTGLGSGNAPAGEIYPPKGHPGLYSFQWSRGRVLPEFQMILISQGHGVFESEPTGEMFVEPGSIITLFPGVWHRYRPDSDVGWTERWISFHGSMTHRLLELRLFFPEMAVRKARRPTSLARAFDRVLHSVREHPTQNSILLSLQAMALIGSVVESITDADELPGGHRTVRRKEIVDPLIAKALDLIWTHSHQAFTVQRFANQLSVSRRVLERRFRDEIGHSVLTEITACRLNRAKRLLRETDLGVKAVAFLAGFSSEERMRVTFVENVHVSPSRYRSDWLEQRKPKLGRPPKS
ncbi:AraC family transcriptional regulator [Neorhodopirellula pilleata]|uniref:Xylose operon regulatory protein n=1 Tax=Neorhodopirellula pilleata TaxID=2714738 RepID=A0A5C6A9E2_9BACT|nr:AraC family transcriptional regulator [Neorhodopirellula pilleata]TWT94943.1 Xylose operon regulatory protein [Neorhodopirellula pilleata]